MRTRLTTIMKAACAAALAVACCAGLSACDGAAGSTASASPMLNTSDTSGGVAATVNGVEIGENAVTAYIETFRSAQGLDDDDAWGSWLIDYGYTIDSLRGDTVDYYVNQELIRQAAEENGVAVGDDQVDEAFAKARSSVDTDEEWAAALSKMGVDEGGYRASLEASLMQKGLMDKVGADAAASDDEVLSYVQMYAGTYNGAKRSSHILFASDDEATAREVLDKINSGELDFAEAAKEHSIDAASAENGGDAGWDKMSQFVDAYQDALDELEVGQVSGLVRSDFGIHIIKCTDQLKAPDEVTSLDQVSGGFVDYVRETADATAKQQAFANYMNEFKNSADIVENALPDGMPYAIDLVPYEEAARAAAQEAGSSASAEGSSSDRATEGAAAN